MHSVQGVKSSVESECHSEEEEEEKEKKSLKLTDFKENEVLKILVHITHWVFFSNLEDSNTLLVTTLAEFKVSGTSKREREREREKSTLLNIYFSPSEDDGVFHFEENSFKIIKSN